MYWIFISILFDRSDFSNWFPLCGCNNIGHLLGRYTVFNFRKSYRVSNLLIGVLNVPWAYTHIIFFSCISEHSLRLMTNHSDSFITQCLKQINHHVRKNIDVE